MKSVAERVGFEPTDASTSPVFKTGSFNHSDISPRPVQVKCKKDYTIGSRPCQRFFQIFFLYPAAIKNPRRADTRRGLQLREEGVGTDGGHIGAVASDRKSVV